MSEASEERCCPDCRGSGKKKKKGTAKHGFDLMHFGDNWPITAKHGFDLTHFGENWPIIVAALDLHYVGRCRNGAAFEWSTGSGATIVTQNNPETGEYGPGRDMRDDDRGYASYIGVEGPAFAVAAAVRAIREHASDIKGESPGKRRFI